MGRHSHTPEHPAPQPEVDFRASTDRMPAPRQARHRVEGEPQPSPEHRPPSQSALDRARLALAPDPRADPSARRQRMLDVLSKLGTPAGIDEARVSERAVADTMAAGAALRLELNISHADGIAMEARTRAEYLAQSLYGTDQVKPDQYSSKAIESGDTAVAFEHGIMMVRHHIGEDDSSAVPVWRDGEQLWVGSADGPQLFGDEPIELHPGVEIIGYTPDQVTIHSQEDHDAMMFAEVTAYPTPYEFGKQQLQEDARRRLQAVTTAPVGDFPIQDVRAAMPGLEHDQPQPLPPLPQVYEGLADQVDRLARKEGRPIPELDRLAASIRYQGEQAPDHLMQETQSSEEWAARLAIASGIEQSSHFLARHAVHGDAPEWQIYASDQPEEPDARAAQRELLSMIGVGRHANTDATAFEGVRFIQRREPVGPHGEPGRLTISLAEAGLPEPQRPSLAERLRRRLGRSKGKHAR